MKHPEFFEAIHDRPYYTERDSFIRRHMKIYLNSINQVDGDYAYEKLAKVIIEDYKKWKKIESI